MATKVKESVVQQTVLNCIDYYNSELKKRNIDKQYRIAVEIFDKNKSPIIGAVKDKAVIFTMTFYLDTKTSQLELWQKEVPIVSKNPDKQLIKTLMDKCFLAFIKECIGLFGLVAEQRLKVKSDNR